MSMKKYVKNKYVMVKIHSFSLLGGKIAQINGSNDSNMQKLIENNQNFSQKKYSTNLPLNVTHVSSRYLDKDTHSTMVWYIDVNDLNFLLHETKKLVEIDIAKILISQFTILEEIHNISPIK